MRNRKRFIAILLSLCMVFSMFPGQTIAFADGPVPTWGSGASVTVSTTVSTSLTVVWPAATNADSYKLTYSNKTGGVMTVNNTISGIAYSPSGYTITGLTAHYRYDISVIPVNSAGEGAALTSMGVTTVASDTIMTMVATGITHPWDGMNRYLSSPVATKNTSLSTSSQIVYNLNSPVTATGANRTRFFWFVQSGFNNSNANNNFKAMRLFDLTTNSEIALTYGQDTDFGTGSAWPTVSITDAGDAITNQKAAGDFIASKLVNSSTFIRFEANIGKYLQPGHNYAFTVDPQFYSGGGTPVYLNAVYRYLFTVADTTAPTWGTGAAITTSNLTTTGATVSYPAATDDVNVAKYTVTLTKVSDNSVVSSTDTTSLSKDFNGLAPGTDYACTVVAKDAAGNQSSALTTTITTVADVTPPAFADGSQITVSGITETGFGISYPAATDDSAVSSYIIALTKADSTPVSSSQTTSLSKTFTGLDAGTGYSVTVTAVDSVGKQSTPLSVNATTLTDANAPTWGGGAQLTTSSVLKDGFTVSYPAANDDVKVAKYVVTVKLASDNSVVGSYEVASLSQIVSSLDIQTEYVCEVVAVDPSGNQSAVLTKNVTTLADATAPVWDSGVAGYHIECYGVRVYGKLSRRA